MSRYIDTKWLEDNAKEYSLGYYDYDEYAVPLSALDSAPSIDIVRCGECAKANTENCSHSYWGDDWGVWRVGYKGDDWFCADGEREGE